MLLALPLFAPDFGWSQTVSISQRAGRSPSRPPGEIGTCDYLFLTNSIEREVLPSSVPTVIVANCFSSAEP